MRAGGYTPLGAPPVPPTPQVFTGLVTFSAIASPANTYLYYPPNIANNGTTTRFFWSAPTDGVIRRPRFWQQTPGGSASRTYTARVNGVATAWVLVTLSSTAGLQIAGAGDIAVSQGDEIDILLTAGGDAGQYRPTYTFEFWGAAP